MRARNPQRIPIVERLRSLIPNRQLERKKEYVRLVTGRSHSACDSIRFLAIDASPALFLGAAGRRFRAFDSMDEADGRPGHVALQFGHMDAFDDAPTPSLSLPLFTPQSPLIVSECSEWTDLLSRHLPSTPIPAPFLWGGPAEGH